VTRHTDAQAPTFHFSGVSRIFEWGRERTEESGKFFWYFVAVVNIQFLRILTHFFHKPHCISWQMN